MLTCTGCGGELPEEDKTHKTCAACRAASATRVRRLRDKRKQKNRAAAPADPRWGPAGSPQALAQWDQMIARYVWDGKHELLESARQAKAHEIAVAAGTCSDEPEDVDNCTCGRPAG